jgi:zinc protease
MRRMPRLALARQLFAAALLALMAVTPQANAQDAPTSKAVPSQRSDVPNIPYTRFVLPNGMVALLNEDHSSPIVYTTVWYHVGSKNEKPGRTGFAHLFEHMMFEGSENIESGQHRVMIQSMGGSFNGSTTEDRTNYYETVPANQLETALWMESDRMATLLTRIDQKRLDAEREIVKNERRLRVDNQPFGVSSEILSAALYPSDYPYSWPVIGSMADLSAASLDDVKDFFRTYYAPNNAVIALSGDFKTAEAKQLLTKYFGTIPRGPAITRPAKASPTLAAEKRIVLEDNRVRLPQLQIAWPSVGGDHPDRFALSALSSVLTIDRTARLQKALVYDRQLATNVFAFNNANEIGGYFTIFVNPRPNASLTDIERAIDSVVAGVQTGALSAKEVQRFKNYNTVQTVTGLQFTFAKGEQLAQGETMDRNPMSFVDDLVKYAAVTPADVQRVARKYLGQGRVVLSMVPAGKLDMVAKPDLPFTNATPASNKQGTDK